MQSQIICRGCRSVLSYGRGASSVRCALCYTITLVPTPDMAQLQCGGCHTVLMYARGATSVRCSRCSTINLARLANQLAHINCGRCQTTLMYPSGAPSVKCAICHHITSVVANNGGSSQSSSASIPNSRSQTVVVENPMSVDESGKLVSNVVVGVTTGKK